MSRATTPSAGTTTTDASSSTAAATPSPLRRTLGLVRPHLRGHRMLMSGGGLALMLEVVFRILEPWPVKFVVDAVTRSLGADIGGGPPVDGTRLLLACALATISVVGLRALSNYLATVAFAMAGSRIAIALRQRVFDHVAGLSGSFHSTARSGDVVQRLVADVGRLQEVAVTAGLPLLANVFTLVAMTGVLLWLDPVLALVVVVAAAAYVLFARTGSKDITRASRRTRKSEGDLANIAQETMGAIKVVQTYNLQDRLSERFQGSNARSLKDGVKSRRLAAALERRTDVLVGVATAVVLFVGGQRVISGAITPGDLVISLTYLKTAMKPLRDLSKYTGRIARASASGERVADLLDIAPDITSPSDPYRIGRAKGDLELRGVVAEYVTGQPVLKGVDLTVPAGQSVALVGPSGSGKSTLTALLLRLLDPRSGSVRLDGIDLRRLDLAELRANVAVVLQDSVLFTGTLADNIRQGRPDASDAEVQEAARRARIADFVATLPDGYDTEVGERGATLSGGQRQRIAIARALLRDAPVVILDEATTGLDPENAVAVRAGVADLTEGRTTVVVTHDEETARGCDRVVWVEDGVVRADGAPEEVLGPKGSAPGLVAGPPEAAAAREREQQLGLSSEQQLDADDTQPIPRLAVLSR